MRGEFIADDRIEVGESSLGESFGLDEAELERSFFENNPIVSQCQTVETVTTGTMKRWNGMYEDGKGGGLGGWDVRSLAKPKLNRG